MPSDKTRRKPVGQLQNEMLADRTRYDVGDVTQSVIDELPTHLWECVDKNKAIIDEPVFCVVMLLVDDVLLKGVVRRKFYAWPFLPQVRANQCVYLYRKASDDLDLLWAMPEPHTMAALACETSAPKNLERVKHWVDAFYKGDFHNTIRKDNNITLETQEEFLKNQSVELIEAARNGHESFGANPTATFQETGLYGPSQDVDSADGKTRKKVVYTCAEA